MTVMNFIIMIKRRREFTREIKIWAVYFLAILFSAYIHELGHCIPAWIHGFRAIPTPAKEYISGEIPQDIRQVISLGGIIGTIVVSFTILVLYICKPSTLTSTLLASALVVPGFYMLRFFLIGRGHDGTEFQEAQSVLGLSYSGHFLDFFFLALFLFGVIIWIIKSKPGLKIWKRWLIGFILTFIFFIGLQELNNSIFDPILQSKHIIEK